MAKKYTMRAEAGRFVVKMSDAKWQVRTAKGETKTLTVSKRSKQSIDTATKKFGGALSRLAYR
jgi:hypothetical protein